MKRILPILSFYLFSCFFSNTVFAQDFVFTEIPNPPNSQFNSFVAQTDDNTYVSYFDAFFNTSIYELDGENLIEIGGPEDYTYGFFITEQDDNLYLAYNFIDYNDALVRYDGANFTVLNVSDYDEFINGYAFSINGTEYFSFFETFNFTTFLRMVDGDMLVDVELPTGLTYNNFIGELNGEAFLTLSDINFNTSLYSYDGISFTELSLPDNTTNPFAIFATDDLLYISVLDAAFNQSVYTFDGVDFTLLEIPTGFNIGGFQGQIGDNLYFRLNDDTYNGTLYELDGTTWTAFSNATYDLVGNGGQSETAIYPTYTDDGFYTFTLGICDGDDLNFVENPVGFQYSRYNVDYENGILLNYFDETFNNSLQFYDNTELITVPPPADLIYNGYEFELEELLYFTFRDLDFNRTLYYLGEPNEIPTAADNTVQTLIETPYMFSISEFNFADIDVDDTLAAIQIIMKPALGILHLDGANIGTGDIVPATEIETLTYVPFNEGMGMPYDSFEFKVFDGNDLSEETYTMFINVLETLVGVNDDLLATSLEIYPNPATNFIKIAVENYTPQATPEILIYNQNGQAIERRFSYNLNETIEIGEWATGVYILVIRDGDSMVSRKVLVQ